MRRTYKANKRVHPYPVYLVVNEFAMSSADDSILIPRNRVPMIPIPMRPTETVNKSMNNGCTNIEMDSDIEDSKEMKKINNDI